MCEIGQVFTMFFNAWLHLLHDNATKFVAGSISVVKALAGIALFAWSVVKTLVFTAPVFFFLLICVLLARVIYRALVQCVGQCAGKIRRDSAIILSPVWAILKLLTKIPVSICVALYPGTRRPERVFAIEQIRSVIYHLWPIIKDYVKVTYRKFISRLFGVVVRDYDNEYAMLQPCEAWIIPGSRKCPMLSMHRRFTPGDCRLCLNHRETLRVSCEAYHYTKNYNTYTARFTGRRGAESWTLSYWQRWTLANLARFRRVQEIVEICARERFTAVYYDGTMDHGHRKWLDHLRTGNPYVVRGENELVLVGYLPELVDVPDHIDAPVRGDGWVVAGIENRHDPAIQPNYLPVNDPRGVGDNLNDENWDNNSENWDNNNENWDNNNNDDENDNDNDNGQEDWNYAADNGEEGWGG